MAKIKVALLRAAHAHLTEVLNDCDAQRAAAQDNPPRTEGTPEAPAQDSARVKTPSGGLPMHEAFPNFNRMRR